MGCIPEAHCHRCPALLLRPPSLSGPSAPLACPDGRSRSGGWQCGMLLSFLFLQLSLHATDHGLHEGQGQRVTGGAPVGLACGNGLTSRGLAGRGAHA